MENLWPRIEQLLAQVSKPARYIGGEQGARHPVHGQGKVAWLLVYPDTYEIGLPNQGLQILYEILNERPDAVAERSYAPWIDMEAAMREAGVPALLVENHLPAAAFDVLAFNLSAELVYTNVLNLIDLAGVPLSVGRPRRCRPAGLAGGHCAFNPEPLADFVDAFVLGDGEEVVGEINEVMGDWLAAAPHRDAPGRCCAALWPRSRACTSRRSTSRATRRRLVASRADRAAGAGRGRPSARSLTWPTGPTRRTSWCP